jgi:hypothetical protein
MSPRKHFSAPTLYVQIMTLKITSLEAKRKRAARGFVRVSYGSARSIRDKPAWPRRGIFKNIDFPMSSCLAGGEPGTVKSFKLCLTFSSRERNTKHRRRQASATRRKRFFAVFIKKVYLESFFLCENCFVIWRNSFVLMELDGADI